MSVFSQVETQILSELKIKVPYISASFEQIGDTKYVMIAFQNAKYVYITDIGAIYFTDKESLMKFCNDLKDASNYLVKPYKTIEWNGVEYRMNSNTVKGLITITDLDNKYFYVSKKNADKLITWMNSIEF